MSLESALASARQKMNGAVEKVASDFAAIRTGRANPALLNNIRVDYYGTLTPLNQLANFSVPEPRMLIVSPFDKSTVSDIEKAIRESDLGLNPSSDGEVIRCVFPELTEERRRDFIKLAKQAAEEGRVAVRNVRRNTREEMKQLAQDGDVGQDDEARYEKQLEELTAEHIARIDRLLEQKEADLLEV